ncbi:MAG: EutN/CcmL family microcompartment protein [Spirochaetes bacterium]|nr:EutN/CcmL family microcompartment protein [Spirochaetota bacterium]
MFYGKVVGTVVATEKDPRFEGYKLLVVQKVDHNGAVSGEPFVAVDFVQAGRGDFVCLTKSKDASWPSARTVPTDAGIMGIIDAVTLAAGKGE